MSNENDNRFIVKIRDLPENERYKVSGLFSGSTIYGYYIGLKLDDDKLAFISDVTDAYENIIQFFDLDNDYDFINRNKYGHKGLIRKDIQDVEMSVTHGTSKKTLKNYTVLNFRVMKNE